MPEKLQRLGRFAVRVGRRFFDDGCPTLAGSLTYTTLLALVPLLTIALTLLTAFPVFEQFTRGVDDFFARSMLPPAVGETVSGYIQKFTESAAQLTAVGIAFLAVTAIALMLTIERAFDRLWRVARPRPLGVRILIYSAVLTLGPLLIGASLTMTSYLVSVSLGFAPKDPIVESLLFDAVAVILTAAAFTLVYFVVPNRPVRIAHAAIGGLAAALLFEVMKRGFAFYVAKVPGYTLIYGAFAALPVFLVWIYLSWVVALLGAVITALLSDYRMRREAAAAPGAVFRAALEILRVLVRAERGSLAPDTWSVLAAVKASREDGQQALEQLSALGLVARTLGNRWALACDPGAVTIAAVYRGMVFDPAPGGVERADQQVNAIIERVAAGADHALDAPIRSLAEDGPAVS